MKAIERISIYLNFRSISPHSFEKKIHLSNGYYSKQLKHLGSVGSDIIVRIHENYPELNILWLLTGEGEMIVEVDKEPADSNSSIPASGPSHSGLNEYTMKYELGNRKVKSLESDLEKLNVSIRDKEKIIGLYEFMLNNANFNIVVSDSIKR